jgi:hypothetical protein
MGRDAARISINLTAGVAAFVTEMAVAKAQVKDFGADATRSLGGVSGGFRKLGTSGVSDVQATSAALRVMEGNMTNNLRASERFIANILGLGPVLRAAFPLVGAVAFGGLLVHLGEEASKFFKGVTEAPARIAGAFRDLNNSIVLVNDGLRITNDKLSDEIAKLYGKPQNNLKLALDEARQAADSLAEALDKDLKKLNEVLETKSFSRLQSFGSLFTGSPTASTADFAKKVGGATGLGGWTGEINKITDDFSAQLQGVTDKGKADEIRAKAREALRVKFELIDTQIDQALTETMRNQSREAQPHWYDAQLEVMRYSKGSFSQMADEAQNRFAQGDLEEQKPGAEAAAAARKLAAERAKQIQAEILELTKRIGDQRNSQISAMARLDVEESNEIQRLAETHKQTEATVKLVEELYDQKRLDEYNKQMEKAAKDLEEFTAKWTKFGIEAKGALSKTMQSLIDEGNPLKEQTRLLDEWAKKQIKVSEDLRSEQVRHSVAMTDSQQGGDAQQKAAVHLAAQKDAIEATYQDKLRGNLAIQDQSIARQIRDNELLNAQNQYEEELARLRHKNLQDFLYDMQGTSKTAGDILYEGLHSAVDRLSDDLAKLLTNDHSGKKGNWGQMFVGTLKSLGEQAASSAIHSAIQRGIAAITAPKQTAAGSPPAHQSAVSKAIHDALDAISGKPKAKAPGAKDGQTPESAYWVQIAGTAGPPGGASSNAPPGSGVIPVGGGPGYIPFNFPAITPIGGGTSQGGRGSSGGSGGGIWSSILGAILGGNGGGGGSSSSQGFMSDSSITFLAGGGDIPDSGYTVVGENGPELLPPGRGAGRTVIPSDKIGGGNTYVTYSVDARGADLGADNRIRRGLEVTHKSAVATSVQANAEYSKRTPLPAQ